MNLVKATVTKVLSSVILRNGTYRVKVEYDVEGQLLETILMFELLEDAEKVTIGYKFHT